MPLEIRGMDQCCLYHGGDVLINFCNFITLTIFWAQIQHSVLPSLAASAKSNQKIYTNCIVLNSE